MDGILLLDKPEGLSSNQALQRVRRLFGAAKAGHTGSLDPLATGMLPCCLGEATKVAGYLLGARKAYAARVRLGATTTTGDREGEVIDRSDVPVLDGAMVETAAARFVGRILQRPPAYSALKRGGVPLYRLARRGETVEIEPRPVEIFSIRVDAIAAELIDLTVVCGAGTYIRSLAVDLGAALGCAAHLDALRRTWVDPFEGRAMMTLSAIEAQAGCDRAALARLLLPVAEGLALLTPVRLDAAAMARFRHGQALDMGLQASEALRVEGPDGLLIGIGAVDSDGCLRPRRLIHAG